MEIRRLRRRSTTHEPAAGGFAATAGPARRGDGTSVFVKVFGEPSSDDAAGESPPDDAFAAEAEGLTVLRGTGGVHLMGRRLYETMLYWETAGQDPSLDDSRREWTALWKPLPKVVFSTTLSAVRGNARLASGGLAEEIARLRAEPGEGDIAIGGTTPAAEAASAGLIDEYRARVHPVLVGGSTPLLPRHERRVDLELIENRTFSSKAVHLRYRVAPQPAQSVAS